MIPHDLMKLTLILLTGLFLGAGLLTSAIASSYPLKVCLVTDNTLGSMGKVITKKHEGQEVKFCCKPCVKKFNANPAKYLAKLK
ncbi:MAG: hypothetical protein GXX91_13340 [Verrucomicrobiaceae bacterium]|mgnify:CR=1 FL=1|nr:hypothetical protein [Verrucomicrobiaceae bacterium]